MKTIDLVVECGKCGRKFQEHPPLGFEKRTPCSNCGSLSRHISLNIQNEMSFRRSLTVKAKHSGKSRYFSRLFQGDDFFRKSSKWVKKTWIIDRENDYYLEKVVERDTGEIIYLDEEPLSNHIGHGSDRRSKV